jgi:DNA polymerase-3 subunit epsilon
MREIVFDTETTGLYHDRDDRIIEIGAVELENGFPTGRTFHHYVNPDGQPVHPDAQRIHGISDADLVGKPVFSEIVADLLGFFGDAILVAHRASFDMGFVNAELARLGLATIPQSRVVDTLLIARRRHPVGSNSLDALCARYGIDNSRRTKHGALLDAELLAEVYIELNGGRQAALVLDADDAAEVTEFSPGETIVIGTRPVPLPSRLNADALAHHDAFVATLGENAIWKRYS